MISMFDIFKIGIGPSSSHTMAPMKSAYLFLEELVELERFHLVETIQCDLYGSLALTGKGHSTDTAILLGLSGEQAETVDIDAVDETIATIRKTKRLSLMGQRNITFDEDKHLIFNIGPNPYNFSAPMRFEARDENDMPIHSQVFFSLGGGFVTRARDYQPDQSSAGTVELDVPHPFYSAKELFDLARTTGLEIAEIVERNELTHMDKAELKSRFAAIWQVMVDGVERAGKRTGFLPGPLHVPPRAPGLITKLQEEEQAQRSDPLATLDWVNFFAIAMNEENASGGRVVTAPTNGAAGLIPAVALYYMRFVDGASNEGLFKLIATAAAIGMIYKHNASFAASEVGCQGEVGVACSMAAGGLVAALGGTNGQIEVAAEAGMEHNLGLTCDPIGGYVQIPCIERNAIGAVKAIDAARLAMAGAGQSYVPLDRIIETMMQTGLDMSDKYKDTGKGGLAVSMPVC